MDEPKIKGAAIATYHAAIVARKGKAEFDAYFAALTEPHRAMLSAGAIASAWYPETLLIDSIDTSVTRWGAEDTYRLAYEQQKRLIRTAHSWLARLFGPKAIARASSSAWKMYRNTGRLRAENRERELSLIIEEHIHCCRPHYPEMFAWAVSAVMDATGKAPQFRILRRPPQTAEIIFSWSHS